MGFFKPNPQKMAARKDVAGLISLLGSKDSDIRYSARQQLGELLRRSEIKHIAIPHLIRAITDPSSSDNAAYLLSIHAPAESVDELVAALKCPNIEIRRNAAEALAKMNGTSYQFRYSDIQPLVDAALGSELDIRRNAVLALSNTGDTRAYEAFCANVADEKVAESAIKALGMLADPRGVCALAQVLESNEWSGGTILSNASIAEKRSFHRSQGLIGCAVRALANIGTDAALQVLMEFIKSPLCGKSLSSSVLGSISTYFSSEIAIEFLIENGVYLHRVGKKHIPSVLQSADRSRRVANYVADFVAAMECPSEEDYEFLLSVVRAHGVATDDKTLKKIISFAPPELGSCLNEDKRVERMQRAENKVVEALYHQLLDAANAEILRRH